jgi:outer membrane receptor for ferrienterochelin and colicin
MPGNFYFFKNGRLKIKEMKTTKETLILVDGVPIGTAC